RSALSSVAPAFRGVFDLSVSICILSVAFSVFAFLRAGSDPVFPRQSITGTIAAMPGSAAPLARWWRPILAIGASVLVSVLIAVHVPGMNGHLPGQVWNWR